MNSVTKVVIIVIFVIAIFITKITGSPEKGTNFFRETINFIVEPFASRISHKAERIGNVYNSQVTNKTTSTSTNP